MNELEQMPLVLKQDLSLGLIAVHKDGLSLQHLPSSLQANPFLAMAALLSNGNALKFASHDLQSDPVIVKTAIAKDGAALQFVQCSKLRAHRGLVLQVRQYIYRSSTCRRREARIKKSKGGKVKCDKG